MTVFESLHVDNRVIGLDECIRLCEEVIVEKHSPQFLEEIKQDSHRLNYLWREMVEATFRAYGGQPHA